MRSRIVLRRPAPSDREAFLALVRESRALHRPWVSPPADRAAFNAYLERNRREDFHGMLACRVGDGEIVGVFNLSQIFHGPLCSAYLGYWVGAPFVGQGYMGEALQQVLARAFRELGLHRVEANIQPGNERSIALVRRSGFRLEGFSPRYLKIGGRWRDHQRWAITIEDWRAFRRSARLRRGP